VIRRSAVPSTVLMLLLSPLSLRHRLGGALLIVALGSVAACDLVRPSEAAPVKEDATEPAEAEPAEAEPAEKHAKADKPAPAKKAAPAKAEPPAPAKAEPPAPAKPPAPPSAPAGLQGAKRLLEPFLSPSADAVALTRALKPENEDYAAVFQGDGVARAMAFYEPQWASGLAIKHDPKQTHLEIWEATTQQLTNEPRGNVFASDAKHFPGGYMKAAPLMKRGLTVYAFRIHALGSDTGMLYDGLVHVNGRWVLFPKPWKALGLAAKDKVGMIVDEGSPEMVTKFLAQKKAG
jgi:hypothetical protein